MLVKFRVNLGSIDAAKYQLDHTACREGCEVEVGDDAAKWLASRGIVEPLPEAKPVVGVAKSAEINAVPPKPEHGTVEKATADLEEYRDKAKGKSKSQ